MTHPIYIKSPNAEFTQELGKAIGEIASAGDVILLTGELGSGKTCLTQGIAFGLGVEGYVRSPTFVLMTRHHGRLTLHHVDLYRMGSSAEAWDLGLDEQVSGDGVCVVEWPDRAPELFIKNGPQDDLQGSPAGSLWVKLAYSQNEDQREITLSGGPEHFCATLSDLAAMYPPKNTTGQGGI